MQEIITVHTQGPGLYEFTGAVAAFAGKAGTGDGLLTLFVRHTSCSLLIQENADTDVQSDLNEFFQRLAPPANDPQMSYLRHRSEGADDMPAHIKAALTQTSISVPVSQSRLLLGTWQGIFLFEHRSRSRAREVVLHLSD